MLTFLDCDENIFFKRSNTYLNNNCTER